MHIPLIYILAAVYAAFAIFFGVKIMRGPGCEVPVYMVFEMVVIGGLMTMIPSPIARVIGEFLIALGSLSSFGAWFALFECVGEGEKQEH